MFESFGFETLTAPQAAVWFGGLLGLAFGVLAQRSRFCLRRAVAGDPGERASAGAVWLIALAVALLGTQWAVSRGWVDFGAHRFMASDLPIVAIVVGGLLFGAGMVLTRGCVSRLTVLGASGNLRALTVIAVFAITAHAALKGLLAPVRTTLGSVTVALDPALPGPVAIWVAVVAVAAIALAVRVRLSWKLALGGLLIGALVPLGWAGTGFVLYDDFDPIALESLSFTSPWAETLFFTVASTSIPGSFGTGLVGGVLVGALVASVIFRDFQWQSFTTPRETGRYVLGGALMGLGGVLAGGCTVGAGLAGVPTLSIAALLALASIIAGARAVSAVSSGSAAPSTTRPLQPAE
ncbi:YeeE/YedE thiosulfate transporter family protein [Marivivens marinus]|uniref:YeeE/YedE thiosulfate transporter family protein n=1 Tax=Marivivens marinus TaxID=3110173 RepID=UPI003B845734